MNDDDTLAPPPTPPKQRKGPHVNLTWREDFLRAYEQTGGFYASAKTAGVNSTTVYDERHRNPAFDQACTEARERYADSREANLARIGDHGNPVGDIVLLKKFRPHEYIEKQISITASFSSELPVEDGRQLLHAMLGQHGLQSASAGFKVLREPAAQEQTREPGHDAV